MTDEYLKTLVAVDRDEKKKDEMTEGTYEGTKIENSAPVAVAVAVAVIYDEQGNKIETAIRDIAEAETQPQPQSTEGTEPNAPPTTAATTPSQPFDESQNDSPDVPLRPIEKKRLHWEGKTCAFHFRFYVILLEGYRYNYYADLAPLTTVGNLVCHLSRPLPSHLELLTLISPALPPSLHNIWRRHYLRRNGACPLLPQLLQRGMVPRPASPLRTNFRHSTRGE